MNQPSCSPVAPIDVLQHLLSSATHDASAAMCRWTNGLISLSLDEVREIPLENVAAELGIGHELLTMVVLTLSGDVGGDMIVTFDQRSGRELAATLLHRPVHPDTPWSPLEQSALAETGNILGCAYMNALTRLIGCELVPSPPCFIQDFGASVIEQALSAQAACSDQVLIFRTGFHCEGRDLNWNVLFVPTEAMRAAMGRSLRVEAGEVDRGGSAR